MGGEGNLIITKPPDTRGKRVSHTIPKEKVRRCQIKEERNKVKTVQLTIIPRILISKIKMTPHLTRLILINELYLPQRLIIIQPLIARHPGAHQRWQLKSTHMMPFPAVKSKFTESERGILIEKTDIGNAIARHCELRGGASGDVEGREGGCGGPG